MKQPAKITLVLIQDHLKALSGIGAFIILITLFHSCHKEYPQIVARVNDMEITDDDLASQAARLYPLKPDTLTEKELKRNVLENMIDQQINLLEAYRLGYDKDEEVVETCKLKESELAGKQLLKMEVDDKILTEDVYRQFYRWMDKKISISRMMFKTGFNDKNKENALKRAEDVYKKLLAGGSFKSLAATYSEHTHAKTDSGFYGMAECYETNEDIFRRAYSMSEGEVSEPFFVPSFHAYYIIKIHKIYPQPIGTFENERHKIISNVKKVYSNELSKRRSVFRANLANEFHAAEVPENIDFFCKRIQKMKTKADSVNLFNDEEKHLVLSKNDVKDITIGFFFPKVIEQYWGGLHQKSTVNMLISFMKFKMLTRHKAMQMKLNELPAVREEFELWKIGYLKNYTVRREVIDKIDVSDKILIPLYNQKKSKLIRREHRTVKEIFCKSEADIKRVHRLAVQGSDFTELERKYSQNKETRTHGVLGPFPKGPHGILGEKAFSMKVGEISSPFRYRGGYSFIKLLSVEPERMKTFDETKEMLKNEYLAENEKASISKWLKKIRQHYSIEINI